MNIKNLVEIKDEIRGIYEKFKEMAKLHFKYIIMIEPRIRLNFFLIIIAALVNVLLTIWMIWILSIVIQALIG